MLSATTELKHAQKVKEYLVKHNLVNLDFFPVKELGRIYFPILKKVKVPGAEVVDTKFSFPQKLHEPSLEELLSKVLTKTELELLPQSQELIGKIMILEIPSELQHKEKQIAQAFLKANKTIETIVRKSEFHSGVYRTRKVKVLAGKNTKETIHSENGIKIKLDIEQAYFSARLAHERLRIAQQVKAGEEVLVMFSGVAPYPLVIARNSKARLIYGIEINPSAHQYALQNVEMNCFGHRIIIYNGDVRQVVPQHFRGKRFNRIVMPLPKTGEEFLDAALPLAKKKGMIHLYAFLTEADINPEKKRIVELCAKRGYEVKILDAVKCGQFSPKLFRICFDMRLS
jgi:tRNA (guanine37-N1)-methyltransferase